MDKGECIIPERVAEALGAGVGDVVTLSLRLSGVYNLLFPAFLTHSNLTRDEALARYGMDDRITYPRTLVPCRIKALVALGHGKVPDSQVEDTIFLEYS